MKSEDEGGWPFGGVPSLADVLPVTRYDAQGHGESDQGVAVQSWSHMAEDRAYSYYYYYYHY